MSPIFESETRTRDDLEKLRKTNVCAVCGAWLNVFLDKDTGLAFVACHDWLRTHHEGIMREASPFQQKGLESLTIAERRKIMEQQHGEETTRALEKYHGVTSLTKPEALEILQSVFPDAPEKEMTRAVLLCTSYSLNPLMGHVFLIPFNKGKENESWATVIGIKAKRLLASRKRPFSYVDDTPRIMTEEEQVRRFGKVKEDKLVVIVKLKDPQTGAEAVGYGEWPLKKSQWDKELKKFVEVDNEPYGTDKGNTMFNMATIRAESQALDRLCPGEMPIGVEVIDETYAGREGKEDFIEGEATEVKEEISPPTGKEPEENNTELMSLSIKNLGELFSACHKHFGLNQSAVLEQLGGITKDQIADVQDAWRQIVEARK